MTLRYLAASAAAIGLCALAACGSAAPAAAPRPSVAVSTTPGAASATPSAAATTPGAPLPVLYNFGGSSAADWNLAQRRPVIFYLAADGSAALGDMAHHLKWVKWNEVSAAATGDYYYRTGPCCNYRSDAVTITANDVVRQGANKSWYDRMIIWFSKSKSLTIQFERIDGFGGWKTAAGSGISLPSQPPATAVPTATAPSGAHDYNIPSQLDAAVLASVEQSTRQSVARVNCVVWPANIHMFTCTVYFVSAGSDVAGVAVTPNGSSYSIKSSG
jgi:hypothetical protein